MNTVNECPYCSYPLLCHVRAGRPYWHCPRCRREAPYAIEQAAPHPPTDSLQLVSETYSGRPTVEQQEQLAIPQAIASPNLIPPDRMTDLLEDARPEACIDVNRLVEDFLSTISHELRTPLSIMRMSLRVIEMTLQQAGVLTTEEVTTNALLAKVAQHLKTLNRECDREIKLVNDLLMLQEFSTAPPAITPGKIVLQVWLRQLIERYVAQASSKHQKLLLEIPADLPVIETDAAFLERIVTELLDNACKFTPSEGKIFVAVKARSGWLQLEICNSGTSIPVELENRIFDTFYRIPSGNPWQHGGTGLGLGLAKKLAEHLHLTLDIDNDNPENTCFTLGIPCPTSQTVTKLDLLMSYVAYYVSRGKPIQTAQEQLTFSGSVYAHWGYHADFLHFWKQLQQRPDFRELYLEADRYSFGEILGGKCDVLECARCRLPRTISDKIPLDTLHCPCDRPPFASESSTLFDEPETANDPISVVIIGPAAAHRATLTTWFAQNGVRATFVSRPSEIGRQPLPSLVHLLVLEANLTKTQAEEWATILRKHPTLRGVPVIALSSHHTLLTPWTEQAFEVADYTLTPLAGRNLANHLQRISATSPNHETVTVHWFPR